jgi:hypothetical protein
MQPRQIDRSHWYNSQVFDMNRGEVDAMSDRPSSCTNHG